MSLNVYVIDSENIIFPLLPQIKETMIDSPFGLQTPPVLAGRLSEVFGAVAAEIA